jgi:hypothetical protein
MESSFIPSVALLVRRQLAQPELRVVGRKLQIPTTGVGMPEAPMDEHNRPILGKNQVRPSSQISFMETVAIASSEQQSSDDQFGCRVSRTYPRHHAASHRRRDYIRHCRARWFTGRGLHLPCRPLQEAPARHSFQRRTGCAFHETVSFGRSPERERAIADSRRAPPADSLHSHSD